VKKGFCYNDLQSMTGDTIAVPNPVSDRWQRRVRAAWYVAAIFLLATVVISLPGYIGTVSRGPAVFKFAEDPPPAIVIINVVAVLASLATVLLSFYLSFVLIRQRPNDRMALFLSFYLLAFAIFSGPLDMADPFPEAGFISFLRNVLFTPLVMYPASCLVFLLIPDGRFAPPWGRWVAAAALATAPVMATISFYAWINRFAVPAQVLAVDSLMAVTVMAGVVYTQYHRYRHVASSQQRQQIKWVIFGVSLMLLIMAVSAIPYFWSLSQPEDAPYPIWAAISTAFYFLAFAILPISLTIAVLRHQLYEIDVIINRTLVYGALSAIVIALYVVAVGTVGILFQVENNLLVSLVVTGLVAVLFQPLRKWLQAKVNRLMFGDRDSPAVVLARLGEHIEANVPLGQLLMGILETVSKSLKLPYAAVELGSGEKAIAAAEYGRPLHTTVRFPLVTHGEQIGDLIVSPRSPSLKFKADERLLLENIARQTSTAVYAGQLYADLQKSRQQIVTAREEERRRLRRDLHDGLGPTMASQTLKLDAAMDLISGDRESGQGKKLAEATKLLRELKEQTQESVKNIRRMVYALRPPALDDLGLIPAIQAHIDQHTSSLRELQVEFTVCPEELPALPAAVEVAVYRIVLEALTNVIRHARAQSCQINLSVANGHPRELQVEVNDDGIGFSNGVKHGVGLSAMRERAEEVGGFLRVESTPGAGTRVRAGIPLIGEEG
jgi:signal transduction histidine kinase